MVALARASDGVLPVTTGLLYFVIAILRRFLAAALQGEVPGESIQSTWLGTVNKLVVSASLHNGLIQSRRGLHTSNSICCGSELLQEQPEELSKNVFPMEISTCGSRDQHDCCDVSTTHSRGCSWRLHPLCQLLGTQNSDLIVSFHRPSLSPSSTTSTIN